MIPGRTESHMKNSVRNVGIARAVSPLGLILITDILISLYLPSKHFKISFVCHPVVSEVDGPKALNFEFKYLFQTRT